jgi:hypothetical protein
VLSPVFAHLQTDSTAIRQLLDSSIVILKRNDLESTRQLIDSIYQIYKEDNRTSDQMLLLTLLQDAEYYDRIGTYEHGLDALSKAESLSHQMDLEDFQIEYRILHGKSALYGRLGQYQKTMEFAQ